jgi:hypothetical protein
LGGNTEKKTVHMVVLRLTVCLSQFDVRKECARYEQAGPQTQKRLAHCVGPRHIAV